jgi:hypothetical protein
MWNTYEKIPRDQPVLKEYKRTEPGTQNEGLAVLCSTVTVPSSAQVKQQPRASQCTRHVQNHENNFIFYFNQEARHNVTKERDY